MRMQCWRQVYACRQHCMHNITSIKTKRLYIKRKGEDMAKKNHGRTKRANGEGMMRRRPNGTWELAVMDGYKPDGKAKIKRFYGATQGAVKEQLKAYQMAKNQGINMDVDYTFGQYSEIWFENHKALVLPGTQENYKYTLCILNRFFGGKKIREIKAHDVEVMLKTLQAEGRSVSSLAKCRGMMYQIMNKAEANDLIMKNPVRFAEKMRHTGPVREKEVFSAEEVDQLMNELPQTLMGNSIRILLGSGARMQEILALEPEHIAPDGSVIRIEQAVKMVRGKVTIGDPKSYKSRREIPLPDCVHDSAIALRNTDKRFIWESRRNPGQPVNPSHFRGLFKNTLKEVAGVKVLNPHSCRHTYVSQLQALGVDMDTIRSLVGHVEIDMTRHYLHVQEQAKIKAINKLNEALPTKK